MPRDQRRPQPEPTGGGELRDALRAALDAKRRGAREHSRPDAAGTRSGRPNAARSGNKGFRAIPRRAG